MALQRPPSCLAAWQVAKDKVGCGQGLVLDDWLTPMETSRLSDFLSQHGEIDGDIRKHPACCTFHESVGRTRASRALGKGSCGWRCLRLWRNPKQKGIARYNQVVTFQRQPTAYPA